MATAPRTLAVARDGCKPEGRVDAGERHVGAGLRRQMALFFEILTLGLKLRVEVRSSTTEAHAESSSSSPCKRTPIGSSTTSLGPSSTTPATHA